MKDPLAVPEPQSLHEWLTEQRESAAARPDRWLDEACRLKLASDLLFEQALVWDVTPDMLDLESRWMRALPEMWHGPEQRPSDPLSLVQREISVRLMRGSLAHVALMLAGYAIENAAKGLAVARGIGSFKGHRVRDRLQQLGFRFTTEQRRTLDRLAGHVEWAGRYPVPLRPSELASSSGIDGEPSGPKSWNSEENRIIDETFDMIRARLEREASEHTRREAAAAEWGRIVGAAVRRYEREPIEVALRRACTVSLSDDGIEVFEVEVTGNQPWGNMGNHVISYADGCHTVMLNARIRATICPCGRLTVGTPTYHPQDRRWSLVTQQYPPPS